MFHVENIIVAVNSHKEEGVVFTQGITEISLGIQIANFMDPSGNPLSLYSTKEPNETQ